MNFQHRRFRVLAAAIYVVALAELASAQSPATSQVHGTISDQTGAVLVGATVTLISSAGEKTTTNSDRRGTYRFEQLQPGRYTLNVAYAGFGDSSAAVDVTPQAVTTRDVRLSIIVAESVQVDDAAENRTGTDPHNNRSSLLLTADDLAAMPEDPEQFLRRMLEMAGSTGQPDDIAVFVDGFREYKRLPPKSAIEMVRINANPFSAEFAKAGPQRIEITTKPGSDGFHGDVRLQGSHSALDSRNPLAPTKPRTGNWNYNGYVQGPIKKQRLDFTLYGGQWEQDQNVVIQGTRFDPVTGSDQPFATAVSAPTLTKSMMVATNASVLGQRFNLSYTRGEEDRRNHGLEAFDVPERAYDRRSTDETARLWWTTIGRRSLNDIRVELTRGTVASTAYSTAPAVLVFDAFNAGGNQNIIADASIRGMQLSETFTIQQGRHTRKAGVQLEHSAYDSTDRAGFGGTFIFGADVDRDALGRPRLNEFGQSISISPIENYRRTLLQLPGYAPSTFWIVSGNANVGVDQWNVGWFFLDDWSLASRLTLSYGVRQDFQSNVSWRPNLINERLNVAPRAALSWVLDAAGKNAIKAGAGVFSRRVEPGITLDTNKLNGADRQQLIIERPSEFPSLPSANSAAAVQTATYMKAADLQVPYLLVSMMSYERQLPRGLFAVGQYTHTRGFHLLRLRNVTAGEPGAVRTAPVLQFESTGRSVDRQLLLALRGHISRYVTFYTNYLYGKALSDTDSAYTAPANSRDLSIEYGASADDQRHRFTAGGTFVLPNLSISPSIAIATGRPFNITTGRDTDGDSLFTDRPAFASAGDQYAIDTPYGLLDPRPREGDAIIPRNFGRERTLFGVNLSVSRSIASLVIATVDVENLLNNHRFNRSNGILTSPTFGQPNQALNGRRIILTLRYIL